MTYGHSVLQCGKLPHLDKVTNLKKTYLSHHLEPYTGLSNRDAYQFIIKGGRLPRPDNSPPGLYRTIQKCWETIPSHRPTFLEVKTSDS